MSDARFVEGPEDFAALCDHLRTQPRLGLDTEFVPEYTFAPELCLVQVCSESRLVAIDPYKVGDLAPLWEILFDPERELIVHAGKEEMHFGQAATGRLPERLFDVQVAAGFVGLGHPLSLDNLVQKVLKLGPLNKGETRTDWRARPLTQRQVEYALDDVRYLFALRDKLGEKLDRLSRWPWLNEEMDRWRTTLSKKDGERWQRVAGAGSLNVRELAVLRELAQWRDDRARKADKPVRWILRDDLLIELSRRQPKTVQELGGMRGLGGIATGPSGREVLEAIREGLAVPAEQCPSRERRREVPDEQMVLKILSAALIHLSHETHLSASLLGSNDDLRDLLDEHLGRDPDGAGKLTRGWRRAVVGDYLLKLLGGKVAIRVVADRGTPRLLFEEAAP